MTLHPPLEISSRAADGIHFGCAGTPDHRRSQRQPDTFMHKLVAEGARKVIVNLNEIPQIDSSGISAIVNFRFRWPAKGGGLHLVCGEAASATRVTVTRLVEAIPPTTTKPRPRQLLTSYELS